MVRIHLFLIYPSVKYYNHHRKISRRGKAETEQFPSTYQFPRNWERPRVQPSPLTKPWWLKLASPKAIPKSIKQKKPSRRPWRDIKKQGTISNLVLVASNADQCTPILIKTKNLPNFPPKISRPTIPPSSLSPFPLSHFSLVFKFNFQNLAGRKKNFPSPESRPLIPWLITRISGDVYWWPDSFSFHFDLSRERDGRRRGFLVIWQGEGEGETAGCTRRAHIFGIIVLGR